MEGQCAEPETSKPGSETMFDPSGEGGLGGGAYATREMDTSSTKTYPALTTAVTKHRVQEVVVGYRLKESCVQLVALVEVEYVTSFIFTRNVPAKAIFFWYQVTRYCAPI